jgi:hypothetical protein
VRIFWNNITGIDFFFLSSKNTRLFLSSHEWIIDSFFIKHKNEKVGIPCREATSIIAWKLLRNCCWILWVSEITRTIIQIYTCNEKWRTACIMFMHWNSQINGKEFPDLSAITKERKSDWIESIDSAHVFALIKMWLTSGWIESIDH